MIIFKFHISMYTSLTMTLVFWLVFESAVSEVLQTITITENDASTHRLANLTELLLLKMKLSESLWKNKEIVALSDSGLTPFKLQSNQLLQPNSGVDRESICPDKQLKIPPKLCKSDQCCKLIWFQYYVGTEINTFLVLIKILDQNDKAPQFGLIKRPYIKIPENVENGYVIDLPMAFDSDSEKYSVQRYKLSDMYQHHQTNDFRLHQTNDVPPKPQLLVNAKLDYERINKYTFRLYAYDFGENESGNSCSTTIEIEIEDLNDNVPKFNQLSYSAKIDENKRVDRLIKYTVTDPDSGRNGQVTVTINDKTDELLKKFQIVETQRNEGYLGLINPLDFESDSPLYEFSLIATDQGTPPLSSTAQVRIHLQNINDNGPKIRFKKFGHSVSNSVSIIEGLMPHSLVVQVQVTDSDTPISMITCCLTNYMDLFYLDRSNKVNRFMDFKPFNLKTIANIDRESSYGSFIRVTIQCTDGDISRPITTNESLNIQIEDINDNTPQFSQQSYVGTVDENQINGVVHFIKSIVVTDKDSGQNGKFEYLIEDFKDSTDTSDFLCDRNSGKIVTQRSLDYETKNLFKFKIVAVDNGIKSLRSTSTITINVQDLNDNAPKFPESHYIFNVAENVTVGSKIGSLIATDADTDKKNKDIYYSIEPRGDNVNSIEIDRYSGDLRTRKPLDRETFESITFKVIAKNLNVYSSQMVRSSESEVDVIIKITDVNDNPPQFKPRPHTKPRVEFVIEQYAEGSTCAELPYTVHDADDNGNSGHNCCYLSLESTYDKLFSLMADTPTYICLSKKPEKYQSLTVTLIASDRPANSEGGLTSKISFPVIIKADPNIKTRRHKNLDPKEPSSSSNNDSKSLITIVTLITVVLAVVIIIVITIVIIRRCSVRERECDNNKCYQSIDLSGNRSEGTKVNYLVQEGGLLQSGMSPGKSNIPNRYLAQSQYSDSLNKTFSRNMEQVPFNVNTSFTPSTYHQILTNQGVRIIQNPNRFNDHYVYEWSPMQDENERSIIRTHSNLEKLRSMSPTKSGSVHASSKILNEDQQDSGYQILNPFGLSSPQHNFINYSPESLIPCENEISVADSRSLTLLNNYFDENNNGSNSKTTPRTMKKNYFQTTFV